MKLVAIVMRAGSSQNVVLLSHCYFVAIFGWIYIYIYFFFFPPKCRTIAIVALTSPPHDPDPIYSGALLFACQSHAYREGGSGLYVVSFKCLIKVSTCCSPNPPPSIHHVHVLCPFPSQLYIWSVSLCVKGFHFISFRPGCLFFHPFLVVVALFVRFYTSLLAKCRLDCCCLAISISALVPSRSPCT